MSYDFTKLLNYRDDLELEEYLKSTKNRPTLTDLYHAIAFLAKQPLVRNSSGKVSATGILKAWNLKDLQLRGIMRLFTFSPRSKIFKGGATEEANLRYSALVPLVLSAFKEYGGVEYSEWDWLDPKLMHFMDADLWTLQPYIVNPKLVPNIPREDAVAMVEELTSTPKTLWSPTPKELVKFPRLLKVQLLQTWVAYPTLRNKFMITDCNNIDKFAPSIYGDLSVFREPNPFHEYVPPVAENNEDEVPW